MKDIFWLWGQLAGRTYSAVSTQNNITRDSSDECTDNQILQRGLIHSNTRDKKNTPKSKFSFFIQNISRDLKNFFCNPTYSRTVH